MSYKIKFHPAAQKESKQSYAWYEERQAGLGERFVAHVNKGLDKILRDPA